MNTPEPSSSFSVYQVVGLIIVFTIFASIVSYSKDLFTFDFSSMFKSNDPNEFLSSVNERTGMASGTPAPVTQNPVSMATGSAASSRMYWCLVGEDSAGRWCLQVQDEKNCDKDRTFGSKNECEQLYPK